MIRDERYQRDLAIGLAYEEHVYAVFRALGEVLHPCRTIVEQCSVGENRERCEIKKDQRFRETGNLFVETDERPDVRSRWARAGIYHYAQPRWFAIGDERTIRLFVAATLRALLPPALGDVFCGFRKAITPTAAGYLLPVRAADRKCQARLEIDGLFVSVFDADDRNRGTHALRGVPTAPSLLSHGRTLGGV